ncbi:MAG: DUF2461 domain-containing protein [Bacteroidota bacterium]
MKDHLVPKPALAFLKTLAKNNNRDWFQEHKPKFTALSGEMKQFFSGLEEKLKVHDDIEKMKIFRIYRDVRFSKDKSPYKTQFSCSYSRRGEHMRGGYYIRITPRETFLGAGFFGPDKDDLLRIRKELELDASDFISVVEDASFSKVWGKLQGETVKTAPKGFDKEHEHISYIRHKQFYFTRTFSDAEVCAPDFMKVADQSFQAIRPYFDLMSDVLTTNLNGESLLG